MPDTFRIQVTGTTHANRRKIRMRHLIAAIVVVAGTGVFATMAASAAPVSGKAIAQMAGQSVQIIQVSGGCGRWRFRGRSGRCHPYTFRR
jgi:hypothetical protein